jgi:hypothetical protein
LRDDLVDMQAYGQAKLFSILRPKHLKGQQHAKSRKHICL